MSAIDLPMSALEKALRAFRAGTSSQDQLLAEVHRELAVERVAPETLLETLGREHRLHPLPDETHELIFRRITGWSQDPTVTSQPGVGGAQPLDPLPPPTIVTGKLARGGAAGGPGSKKDRVAVGSLLQSRFTLVELIGEGGMSRVFKAIDLRRVEAGAPDPHIAVKVLTLPFSHYFGSMAALQREAHKLQRLNHPYIVRVMDCDRDGQTVFMTMELLAGRSLYAKLRDSGPAGLGQREAERIVIAAGEALNFAHSNNIVHGDLKPGNVIVDDAGDIKIIDFGMARFIARSQQVSAEEGGNADPSPEALHDQPAALTPRYASPEMLAGKIPEPADDVYALACLAYEILTGHHPYDGKTPDAATPLPPRPTGTHVMNGRQYKAILRGLTLDRARRTPTVRQFLEEFGAPTPSRALGYAVAAAAALLVVSVGLYLLHRAHTSGAGARFALVTATSAPGTVFRDCPTCPLMTLVPAGKFMQGSAPDDANAQAAEQPQHPVTIPRPLAVGMNEITVAEFRAFVDETGSDAGATVPTGCSTYDGTWQSRPEASWKEPGYPQTPLHPASCISWSEADAYARWLTKKTGQSYRLPSASEWEYAARAGSESTTPWKGEGGSACRFANVSDQSASRQYPGWDSFPCSDGYVAAAPVGSFKANAFGLYDLLGNVFEWTQDCWQANYEHAPADGSAVKTASCPEHELRGGSWFTAPQYVRAAYRNRFAADYRSSSVGFRVVREVSK